MGPGGPRVNAAFLVMPPIYIGVSKSNILRWEHFMRITNLIVYFFLGEALLFGIKGLAVDAAGAWTDGTGTIPNRLITKSVMLFSSEV